MENWGEKLKDGKGKGGGGGVGGGGGGGVGWMFLWLVFCWFLGSIFAEQGGAAGCSGSGGRRLPAECHFLSGFALRRPRGRAAEKHFVVKLVCTTRRIDE